MASQDSPSDDDDPGFIDNGSSRKKKKSPLSAKFSGKKLIKKISNKKGKKK